MSNFFSFYIDKKGRIFNGNFRSHESAEKHHNLSAALKSAKPPVPAEWTEGGLRVRLLNGGDANYYRALILGQWPTREKLIAHCIETKNYSSLKDSLHAAVDDGHVGAVKLILAAGASAKDPWALQMAVIRGHKKIIRLLLDAGADGTDSITLRLAQRYDLADIVKMLTAKRRKQKGKK